VVEREVAATPSIRHTTPWQPHQLPIHDPLERRAANALRVPLIDIHRFELGHS